MSEKSVPLPSWLLEILRCPACGGSLPGESASCCSACGFRPRSEAEFRDFTLPGDLDETTLREAELWPDYVRDHGPLSAGKAIRERYPHPPSGPHPRQFWTGVHPRRRLAHLEALPRPDQQEILERSLLRVCLSGRGRALEIGCGSAWASRELALAGWRVVAGDPSPGMLVRAREHHDEMGLKIPLLRCPGQRLPFAPASFDLVLCASVLHHVPDLPPLLAEIRRVLRPDGRLVALFERFEAVGTPREDFLRSSDAGRRGLHEGFVVLPELVETCADAGLLAELHVPWSEGHALGRGRNTLGLLALLARGARRSGLVDLHARPSGRGGTLLPRLGAALVRCCAGLVPRGTPPERVAEMDLDGVGLLDGWYEREGAFRWSEERARVRIALPPGPRELRMICSTLIPQRVDVSHAGRLIGSWTLDAGHHRLRLPLPLPPGHPVLEFRVSPPVPPARRPLDPRPLGMALRRLETKKVPPRQTSRARGHSHEWECP